MRKSSRIRELHAQGVTKAEIARRLKVSRQAVYSALQRQDPGVARDQGKVARGRKVSVWLSEELTAAVDRAQRKNETRSACITRLIERGLRRA